MATYTNAQKLSAVLNHWASPLVNTILESNISAIPFIGSMEAKIKSSGWVSQSWSITKELAPFIGNISQHIIEPILASYISGIPDESIPAIAHSIVDNAIQTGEPMTILEGKITFTREDLLRLKDLLNYNLTLNGTTGYVVATEPNEL